LFQSPPITVEPPKSEEQSPSPTIATPATVPVPESASSDEYEKMVQNIMDMGYERTQVTTGSVCLTCIHYHFSAYRLRSNRVTCIHD